jgi:hypothetical protein
MFRLLIIMLLGVVVLAGCAGDPVAKSKLARVKVGIAGSMQLERLQTKVFYGETCNEIIERRPRVLTARNTSAEIKIPFNIRLSMQFEGLYVNDGKRLRCTLRISFIPMKNTRYQMIYSADDKGCNVSPRRISKDTLGNPTLDPVPTMLTVKACK